MEMKDHWQHKCSGETGYVCYFQHRFAFYLFNLHEVVSAEIMNVRADYYKPAAGKGYFWARYEVQLSYRHSKDKRGRQQKVFSRGCIINDPHFGPAVSQGNQPVYSCEATVSYQAAPFLPGLFPFLNWLNFVPFKIWLKVAGRIRESSGERSSSAAECACVQNREVCTCPENTTYALRDGEDKAEAAAIEAEEEKAVVDLDLLALEQKEMLPGPDPGKIHTPAFERYYHLLVEHERSIQQQLGRKAAVQKDLQARKKNPPQG